MPLHAALSPDCRPSTGREATLPMPQFDFITNSRNHNVLYDSC